MRTLFFDTETTGFCQTSWEIDDPRQADVVQIAMQLYDDRKLAAELQCIVIPSVEIGAKAAEVHGITIDKCNHLGFPQPVAVAMFHHFLSRADRVVAFNTAFDWLVMRVAYARANKELMQHPNVYCSMISAVDVVKKPAPKGSGYGWPKLSEAYRHAFGEDFDDAHDAMADVRALVRFTHWLEDGGNKLLKPKGWI